MSIGQLILTVIGLFFFYVVTASVITHVFDPGKKASIEQARIEPAPIEAPPAVQPMPLQPYAPGFEYKPEEAADKSKSAVPESAQQQARKTVEPSFDVIRIDPNGEAVLAGRAEPDWQVRLESKGQILGQAKVDKNGEWVIIPDAAIQAGDHDLELLAMSPSGDQTLRSSERIAVAAVAPEPDLEQSVALKAETTEPSPETASEETPTPPEVETEIKAEVETEVAAAQPQAEQQEANDKDAFDKLKSFFRTEEQVHSFVSFHSVDFLSGVNSSGRLVVTGEANSSNHVRLFLNEKFIGETKSDASGKWVYLNELEIESGIYTLRAQEMDVTGSILSQTELPFERPAYATVQIAKSEVKESEEKAPEAIDLAAKQETEKQGSEVAAAESTPKVSSKPKQVAAESHSSKELSASSSSPRKKSRAKKRSPRGRYVIVKRGDSLWRIAKRYYGRGNRYTKIYRLNSKKIGHPDLIYPRQRFRLP